jgi:hypothetical protein
VETFTFWLDGTLYRGWQVVAPVSKHLVHSDTSWGNGCVCFLAVVRRPLTLQGSLTWPVWVWVSSLDTGLTHTAAVDIGVLLRSSAS